MILRRLAIVLSALAATALALPAGAIGAPLPISGSVDLAEPTELGGFTSFSIRVMDVTDGDAEPLLVGGIKVTLGDRPLPLGFRLMIDEAGFVPGNRYVIEVLVDGGSGMRFETAAPVPVDPFAGEAVRVVVAPPAFDALHGTGWTVPSENAERPRLTLGFRKNGRGIMAFSGCRDFTARTVAFGQRLAFRDIEIRDAMPCSPEALALAARLQTLLEGTRAWRLDDAGLVLLDAAGSPIETLVPR